MSSVDLTATLGTAAVKVVKSLASFVEIARWNQKLVGLETWPSLGWQDNWKLCLWLVPHMIYMNG